MRTIEDVRQELTELISNVDRENFERYYDSLPSIVASWRDAGGKGAPVHQHLMHLWELNGTDDLKVEVLEDVMSRMVGYCPRFREIRFPDWDGPSNRWLEDGIEQ